MTLPETETAEQHSTYCNCIKCAVPIVNPFPHLKGDEWKAAMMRKGLEMFGPDIHEKWTGRREEPLSNNP